MDNLRNIIRETLNTYIRPCDDLFLKSIVGNDKTAKTLNESYFGGPIANKSIVTKFDHLKWKMSQETKQILDDFVSMHDEDIKEKDYEYMSKKTGIPLQNLKSIKNTYGVKEEKVVASNKNIETDFGKTAVELGLRGVSLGTRDKGVPTKMFPMNQAARDKTRQQEKYETPSPIDKVAERKIPEFLYEWLCYVLKDKKNLPIIEAKVTNRLMSGIKDKKAVRVILKGAMSENFSSGLDKISVKDDYKSMQVKNVLLEFNKVFGTNFLMADQYSTKEGHNNITIENYQTVIGNKVSNKNPEGDYEKKTGMMRYYEEMLTSGTMKNGEALFTMPAYNISNK